MLKAASLTLPTKVHVHGFLTVNGEKMSKSRGTFIMARSYLEELDPAYLRYYYASKLTAKVDDIDLDVDDFVNKVNSDLVGKVVNLASRSARFVQESGLAATYPDDGGLFEAAAKEGEAIAQAYEECDYSRAMRLIMALADRANEYVDRMQPWALKKQPGKEAELQAVCSVALNLYRQIVVYLAPVLPGLAEQSGTLMNAPITSFSDANTPLVGTRLSPFTHLMQRADAKKLQKVIEATRTNDPAPEPVSPAKKAKTNADTSADYGQSMMAEPLAPECTIDDFAKVDLRVARIVSAEEVPEAKKLLKLTVNLGGEIERTIFAGIKSAYSAEKLTGRLVVVVANLKPRKMKFGTSEGMVIAAGPGGEDIFLLSPDSGAVPGQRVG
jgi:methionyl-tRNA synthetase